MGDAVPEEKIVFILSGLIKAMSMAVDYMAEAIEARVFLDADGDKSRWRYPNPNALTLQVLKCVRIVSALRAAMILLSKSHTTEVGVLFRTIDDFISDIMFVDEVVSTGKSTLAQQEYFDKYFDDEASINHNERRQKVQASEARAVGGDNPDRIKKIVKQIDHTFSGVIHGDYSSTMEMYGGPEMKFHMEGVPYRYPDYRHFTGLQICAALNALFKVAVNLGFTELATHLRALRQEFVASPAYTQHTKHHRALPRRSRMWNNGFDMRANQRGAHRFCACRLGEFQ
jgi:hypothetical protein